MTVRREDYASDVPNAWCPGCGNFGILEAVRRALVEEQLAPHQVVITSGIGQAPKLPHYLRVNTFNGLHGREVAAATAIKLCAPDLCLLVHSGDGGAYGEGLSHLIHAIRRNVDLTLVVHDNKVYGLTKGQASPTTDLGLAGKLQPCGVLARPLNPLALAISQGCSFVAQEFSGRIPQLAALLRQAITHPGFALVNVLQPCVSWDKIHSFAHYQERCREIGPEHDPADRHRAMDLAWSEAEHYPVGVLYRESRPAYQAPAAARAPLRDWAVEPDRIDWLLARFS